MHIKKVIELFKQNQVGHSKTYFSVNLNNIMYFK